MKKLYYTALVSLILFLCPVFSSKIVAQSGQGEVSEGTEFYFTIPHCAKELSEGMRGSASVELWVNSEKNSTVYVETKAHGSFQAKVNAGKTTKIPLDDSYMNTKNEVIQRLGIHLTSTEPVSVTVFISYRWSGETFRVIPAPVLGNKYYTVNLYQDETDEMKPSQIVITATRDNTIVTYTPTFNTEKTKKGIRSLPIILNKGETYLIHNEKKSAYTHTGGDLTGTLVEADKPIAVISGHTKGAFPRYSARMLGRPANFMRNTLVEMLLPVTFLGTEYVSAPILYTNRYVRNIDPDDVGDMIRFVATVNGTIISQMKQDGTEYKNISKVLKAGEYFEITNMESAAAYRSNCPVVAAQYGKSWRNQYIASEAKSENTQNPARNGAGMLMTLVPVERWISNTRFYSPSGLDNFVYVVFNIADAGRILFDGVPLIQKFGLNAIKSIQGTPYGHFASQIPSGDHSISGAKFSAYSYGNWDYSKDGFAYGHNLGCNYRTDCKDSLTFTYSSECANVKGEVKLISDSSECSKLSTLYFASDSSYNFVFKNTSPEGFGTKGNYGTFELTIIDEKKPARAFISASSTNGNYINRIIAVKSGCFDSIEVVNMRGDCGKVKGRVNVLAEEEKYARIDTIWGYGFNNCTLNQTIKSSSQREYTVEVVDKAKKAECFLTVKTARITKEVYSFVYETPRLSLQLVDSLVSLGKIKIGKKLCKDFKIYNLSRKDTISITGIEPNKDDTVFTYTAHEQLPYDLSPQKGFSVTVCASCNESLKEKISVPLIVSTDCTTSKVGYVSFLVDTMISSSEDFKENETKPVSNSYYNKQRGFLYDQDITFILDELPEGQYMCTIQSLVGESVITNKYHDKNDLIEMIRDYVPKGLSFLSIQSMEVPNVLLSIKIIRS